MKPEELVSEERLEELYEQMTTGMGSVSLTWDEFLRVSRAVLEKLNIQMTTEIGANGCRGGEGDPKRPRCEHFDWDTGCELCRTMPKEGALLVRMKDKPCKPS